MCGKREVVIASIGGVLISRPGCCAYVVYVGLQACSRGDEEGVGGEEGGVGLGGGRSIGEGSRECQLLDPACYPVVQYGVW